MSDQNHEECGYEADYQEPMPGEGRPQSNVLGIVGFILSFCISPIGLILSLIALRKPPRGLAIGGVVVGLLGTAVWAVSIAGVVFAFSQPIVKVQNKTVADYATIAREVEAYQTQHGALPTSLDQLTGLKSDQRTDYWGHPYVLQTQSSGGWSLRVAGPDGKADTGDDLVIPGGLGAFDLAFKFQDVAKDWAEALKSQQNQGTATP